MTGYVRLSTDDDDKTRRREFPLRPGVVWSENLIRRDMHERDCGQCVCERGRTGLS